MTPILVAAVGLLVLVVALVGFVVSRIRVAGPNEAFIITGRKGKAGGNDTSGQKVVMGASVFVVPFVQKLGVMGLSSRQIGVSVGAGVLVGRTMSVGNTNGVGDKKRVATGRNCPGVG